MKAPMSRLVARLLSHPKTARALTDALKVARDARKRGESVAVKIPPNAAIQLIEVDGKQARWDMAKGILIDPPFGPWPRDPHFYDSIEASEEFPPPEAMPGAPPLGWHDKFNRHICCWLWKAALVIPIFHLLLHGLAYFGIVIPHPEVLSFIP